MPAGDATSASIPGIMAERTNGITWLRSIGKSKSVDSARRTRCSWGPSRRRAGRPLYSWVVPRSESRVAFRRARAATSIQTGPSRSRMHENAGATRSSPPPRPQRRLAPSGQCQAGPRCRRLWLQLLPRSQPSQRTAPRGRARPRPRPRLCGGAARAHRGPPAPRLPRLKTS